jgi:hypothetical protein
MKKLQLNASQQEAQKEAKLLANQKNVFASRKSRTKSYAVENKLFLKANQTSQFENKVFEIKTGENSYKSVRIDWEKAIKEVYNVSLAEWLSLDFKSQVKTVRNLSSMTQEEVDAYNREASRKSKMIKQLKTINMTFVDFLKQIEVDEDKFKSDEFLAEFKSQNVAEGRKVDCSPYQLSTWLS